jgi:hypothetical protein
MRLRRPSAVRLVVYLLLATLGTAYLYADRLAAGPDGTPVRELGTVIAGRTSQGLPVQGYVRDGALVSLVLTWRADQCPAGEQRRTGFRAIRGRGSRFSAPGDLTGRISSGGDVVIGTFRPPSLDAFLADGTPVACRPGVLGFRAGA